MGNAGSAHLAAIRKFVVLVVYSGWDTKCKGWTSGARVSRVLLSQQRERTL